jgi:hypothetical protein
MTIRSLNTKVRSLSVVLLCLVILFGVFVCLIGLEAMTLNPVPWWTSLTLLVIVPAILTVLVWPRRRPPEM